ncbi:hypothetical protein BC826DRAFT_209801 [Russula brevipes]|nr:hypothetical protein BC826DRAFT_209801 [Russula brevipes]
MNENKDIATSFKYVVDMEAERSARARQYQSLPKVKSPRVNAKPTGNLNATVSERTAEPSEATAGPSTSNNKAPSEELLSPSGSGSKGKRKVTFDIKSAVQGGEREAQEDDEPGEASVFELEDDNSDASQRDPSDSLTLTLRDPVESPTRPPRPPRQPRTSGGTALPQLLQTLRPASLPPTVALRASDLPQPPDPPSRTNAAPSSATEDITIVDEALSPRDQELARLVNVTTPSHRKAWKKDSQSWRLFGSGSGGDISPDSQDNETDVTAVSHGVEPNGKHCTSEMLIQSRL